MKKILISIAIAALSVSVMFGQMLEGTGVKNTVSTTFGQPYNNALEAREPVRFYGFIETLQARIDVSNITLEGMLNWGALSWAAGHFSSFTFANTTITPFWYTNHFGQGGWWTDGDAESYYVNFLFNPVKGLDFGMGTRLAWKVGPAPAANGNYWEPYAHIVQGGLKDAEPGKADVVGFTYYANSYTAYYNGNTKAALAARYHYEDLIEIGVSLPSGVTVDAPVFNLGLKIHPIDLFTIAVAYDGILQSTENLYTGISLNFNRFLVDAWLGLNMRGNKDTLFPTTVNAGRWGTGLALTFGFADGKLMLRPEGGVTVYNYANYTVAGYVGGRLDWNFYKDTFKLGCWSSAAWGADDVFWHDQKNNPEYKKTNDYFGGFIFDIRPDLTWNISANHSITLFFDYQNRTSYDRSIHDVWASGLFWTFQK